MRARSFKPDFFKNELLAKLHDKAKLLFIGLWCMADREGRLEDRPKRIEAEIFPYQKVNVNHYLDELSGSKDPFIIRYQVEGNSYIQITNFRKHQNPHPAERPSMIPKAVKLNDDAIKLNGTNGLTPSSLTPSSLNPSNTLSQATKRPLFLKPTPEEVTAYARAIGYSFDGHKFCDHYEANGWKVGRNPMKDWKAAARTWIHSNFGDAKPLPRKESLAPVKLPEGAIPL